MTSPRGGYPSTSMQPAENSQCFRVTGVSVASAAGTTGGLDARGADLCTISDGGGATQTIVFKRAFAEVPYVELTPETVNGAANATVTATGITLVGVKRDDDATSLADQNWSIRVTQYTNKQAVQS